MKKKVLITGASGFIGSFLIEEALKKGFEVYAGIRKTSSKQFLQHAAIRFFELDFSSVETLTISFKKFKKIHEGFDYIIHNAGITQAKKHDDFYTVNFEYTKNLVEAIRSSSMPLQKFVFISSLASYGPGNAKPLQPIEVSDEHQPISVYGKSKLKATQYICGLSDFPYLIIHPTGVYGPRDKDFLQFFKLVNKGFEPYIGRHKQLLSLIYVKDVAKAVIALLSSSYVNRSYLLSDGRQYDKEQIGIEAKRFLNKKTIKLKLPMRLVQTTVAGIDAMHQLFFNRMPFLNKEKLYEISSANWLCNSDDVWEHINDTPSYSLQQGVAETIVWYKENKWL